MKAKIIEGTNQFNWGKFLILQFTDAEWSHWSEINKGPLLRARGWGPEHIWVLDIETGEGFCTRHGGMAVADLAKHAIWVCPMYEPFLEWLYKQNIADIDKLPNTVDLVGESALAGYRRKGIPFDEILSGPLVKVLNALDIYNFHQLTCLTRKTFLALIGKRKNFVEEIDKVFKAEGYYFQRIRQQ